MEGKRWFKSVTLGGAIATLIGGFEVVMQDPTLLQPFVDVGLLTVGGSQSLAKLMVIAGGLTAIIGRVRKGGGAPLTM